jgi:nucleotide-binding universal stress UspA family protein
MVLAGGAPGHRPALQRSVFVARTHGALLSVTGLVSPPCPDPDNPRQGEAGGVGAAVVRACRETIEHLVEPFHSAGVPLQTKVLCGTPFLAIIQEVLRCDHDLVIMSADTGGGIRSALFGSTSRHLLRKCPCPVWLLKDGQVPYRRVLAGVDPECEKPEKAALNLKVLEIAGTIAELERAELHIAHAWSVEFEGLLRSRAPKPALRQLLRETRQQRKDALQQLAAPFARTRPHQVHLRKGDPVKVLPYLARRKNIDLVVLGTVCRTGVAGLLIGNTAEHVLGQVDCSVLVVKPEGFYTPVSLDEREHYRAA